MKKDCKISFGYNEQTKEFYWNIDDKIGIVDTKTQLIECCTCEKFKEWCNKSDALYLLLSQNAPQIK